MGMPSPGSMVRKQTEAISGEFAGKKAEIMGQIDVQVAEQLSGVYAKEREQLGSIEKQLSKLLEIKAKMDPNDPQRAEIVKRIEQLRTHGRMIKAQTKLAVASIKANAARQKENIKSNLERQKAAAIRSTIDSVLAQYTALMQKRKAAEGAVHDELKAGNRG